MPLDAALQIAARGYRVFPVDDQKHPHIKGWPAEATRDQATIRRWWSTWPAARAGVACGDGLVVVDLDVKNGHNGVQSWNDDRGLSVATPSGGQHRYFRTDEAFGSRAGVLTGVDVRAARGFAVAWCPGDLPPIDDLPVLPEDLARRLRVKTEPAQRQPIEAETDPAARADYLRTALEAEAFKVECAPEGKRNDTLNAAAFNLGQLVEAGLDADEVRERLTEAAEAAGLDRGEIAATLSSGLDAGQRQPRDVPTRAAEPDAPVGSWQPVDIAALLAGGLRPTEPTLLARDDGLRLLYPGRTHSVSGESGSGKSWLAQWVAAETLKAGGRVLYLDYEDHAAAVVARLRSLGCSNEQLLSLAYVNPASAPRGKAFEALLGVRYTFAVVDGVTEALASSGLSGDNLTNSNDAVTRWHAMLPKRIAEATGAAVLQVDHVTKAKDSRGSYAIGGQAKRAAITGAAYIVGTGTGFGRGRSGEFDLYVSKDREGYVFGALDAQRSESGALVGSVQVVSEPDSERVTLALLAPGPGVDRDEQMRERVAQFLAELPDDHLGAGLNMLRREVKGGNAVIDQALHQLVAEGYVTVEVKGQSKLHRLAKPYAPEFTADQEGEL